MFGAVLQPKQIKVRDTTKVSKSWHVFALKEELFSSFVCLLYTGGYAFMGSLIIQEVVKDLLKKGLENAKVLLLAGSRCVHM